MLIQFLNKQNVKRPTAFFLLFVFTLWSCQKNNFTDDKTPGANLRSSSLLSSSKAIGDKYTPEQFFTGIMFGEGAVADVLPEIKNLKEYTGISSLNTTQKTAVKTLQQSILKDLSVKDPDFLKGFQKQMQSGNQLTIRSAIMRASERVNQILLAKNKGLQKILDNQNNYGLRKVLNSSQELKKIDKQLSRYSINPGKFQEHLPNLGIDLKIDRALVRDWALDYNFATDIFINLDKNLNTAFDKTNINRALDYNLNLDFALDKNININKNLALQFDKVNINNSLDFNLQVANNLAINKSLALNLDRVAINRSADYQFNPGADVTVDVETAIYAVAVVAVAVVAVAVLVFGTPEYFNDKGLIFPEQLVNSIAVNFNTQQF